MEQGTDTCTAVVRGVGSRITHDWSVSHAAAAATIAVIILWALHGVHARLGDGSRAVHIRCHCARFRRVN